MPICERRNGSIKVRTHKIISVSFFTNDEIKALRFTVHKKFHEMTRFEVTNNHIEPNYVQSKLIRYLLKD